MTRLSFNEVLSLATSKNLDCQKSSHGYICQGNDFPNLQAVVTWIENESHKPGFAHLHIAFSGYKHLIDLDSIEFKSITQVNNQNVYFYTAKVVNQTCFFQEFGENSEFLHVAFTRDLEVKFGWNKGYGATQADSEADLFFD